MTKSLDEIATEIDEAADALHLLAEGVAGPDNAGKAAVQIYNPKGKLIDLRALASDIRQHAVGLSNT